MATDTTLDHESTLGLLVRLALVCQLAHERIDRLERLVAGQSAARPAPDQLDLFGARPAESAPACGAE